MDSPLIIHTCNLCKSQIYIFIYFFSCLWTKISFQCNKDNILTKTWWSCHKYLQNCNSCYLIRPHYLKLMREVRYCSSILTSLLGQKKFMFIWEKMKGFFFWERGGKLNNAKGLVIADKDTQTSFLVHAVCSPVFHFRNVKMKLTNKYSDFIIIKTNPNALKNSLCMVFILKGSFAETIKTENRVIFSMEFFSKPAGFSSKYKNLYWDLHVKIKWLYSFIF